MNPLPRKFFDRDTAIVARELLGCRLVHQFCNTRYEGRIVEVEAYVGSHDKASHSSRGLTPRTRIMFGPPGRVYVYRVYGIHHCVNVVTEQEGRGCAVLIRAVEPLSGIKKPTHGPGLLCAAMKIDLRQNGGDLEVGPIWIEAPPTPILERVVSRPRIGVDYAGSWARRLLRFYLSGSAFVSRA